MGPCHGRHTMSRYRVGLLTAVTLVGVGLAVCLGALTESPTGNGNASAEPRLVSGRSLDDGSRESFSEKSTTQAFEHSSCQQASVPALHEEALKSQEVSETLATPAPVLAEPHPSITYQIQAPPSESALMELLGTLQERLGANAGAPQAEVAREPGDASPPAPLPGPKPQASSAEPIPVPEPVGTVDDLGNRRFEIHFQNEDIRGVLEAISEHAGLNIIVSDTVQGSVTANFVDVDVMEALDAILKSTGFLARQEGEFLYVGAADDFLEMEKTLDELCTRIYRPNFVTATELQTLITPLLTQEIGFVSISSAAEIGIPADDVQVGGDSFAGEEVLLIRDYSAVLAEVDQIIAAVDTKPLQVAIEATILSIKLDDKTKMGVSFEFLKDNPNVRFGIGSPANALPAKLDKGGLQFGFVDANLGEFIDALETIQDTNVIATPRVLVLNKHRAEVQIGKQDGYINSTVTETSTSQSVAFLDTGTILRIRPFISRDGLIRMELHPELSTGTVVVEEMMTIPKKEVTQVTTNVMVRDGCTVIIGGLIREQITNETSQIPLLGGLPYVGPLFRSKEDQSTVREEILILLTPHIIPDDEACTEGARAACEFHRRRDVMVEKSSPFSREHISRQYFKLAQNAWAQGDRERALRYAEISVHYNPGSRAAIDLRSDIWMNEPQGGHTLVAPTVLAEPAETVLDDEALPPWVLQRLQETTNESLRPSAPSGEAAFRKEIQKPGGWR
jgi:type IV pilus assembly protein PilQ